MRKGIEKHDIKIRIPKEHADFLMKYCREEAYTERATWIANLVIREVKKIQEQEPSLN